MSYDRQVLVLDYGSQFNLLITRRLRELGVYSELISPPKVWNEKNFSSTRAVILSGGSQSVYNESAPRLPQGLLETNIPLLGICYGMQLICQNLAGLVVQATSCEYGPAKIRKLAKHPLLKNVGLDEVCWMSHGDRVEKLPAGFQSIAETDNSIAAIAHQDRPIYGLQFHPEVAHSQCGTAILKNFLELARCSFDWTPAHFIEESLAAIKKQVGSAKVACALSGGVDSAVAATLVNRAIGDRLICLFVDQGLLRLGEAERVMQSMTQAGLQVRKIDAQKLFLERLAGISEPEQKRKTIGHSFIEVFEQALVSEKVDFLVQGTVYPDIVESGGGNAATIKSHHNVGGLPENMRLKLVEPLRHLFKDEVRKVGLELGLPAAVVERQPFPGPGLAVRLLGPVSKERLDTLRQADAITTSEIEAHLKPDERPWQYYAALLPIRSVGVMGDGRSYGETIVLRAVRSLDAMTADAYPLDYGLLEKIVTRIVNEVKGINRVVYDLTPKPPGTIEWE